jgi:threonine dehydrogenase-like Zn-dependent dehydrogenase
VKAARIHSFGPPDFVVVEDVPVPSPGPGEVLVRVMAAGVAPWDAIIREGKSKVSPQPPLTLGSDFSGAADRASTDDRADHAESDVGPDFIQDALYSGRSLPSHPECHRRKQSGGAGH